VTKSRTDLIKHKLEMNLKANERCNGGEGRRKTGPSVSEKGGRIKT